ncbi:transposase [Guptibacillus hwajinpoensis]|uniref:Transposase IS200-like domain-containing protein n=2 Tax=Guptibacillus hwajinpoensis TaxID=208199 RepID=A0A0J6CKK4_9BACL|nr:transposase [Alkalihalobacillus macyae]KMM36771.1 hypothetical protein AB986_12615 [Alkalihalobacillus macyae]
MPRKARQKSHTGIYHIIYRGANRQEIFHDDEDRLQFLQTLEKYSTLYKVKIYAWCLMSNHVHLLMKEGNEGTVEEWEWSSCKQYYQLTSVTRLVDYDVILNMFGKDRSPAIERFKEFNEIVNDDRCLEDVESYRRRLTDDEARFFIEKIIGKIEIAQVKSLPKERRDPILRKAKCIEGVSQRQIARILGVSQTLIYRA